MQHITKCVLSIGILCAIWGYQTLSAYDEASSQPWFQWNYGTLENPIYTFASQLPAFVGSWNYGTLDMPVWFSFGPFDSSAMQPSALGDTMKNTNSSNSMIEEIIHNVDASYGKITHAYSPDGNSFSYIAINTDWKKFVVTDDISWKKYDDIWSLVYSSGSVLTYIATQNEKSFVVRNGVEWPRYDVIKDLTCWMGNAYIAQDGERRFVVKDGIEWLSYDQIENLVCSQDGKHIAYVARDKKDGQQFVVKDGIEWSKYSGIGEMIYSPDGQHLAYIVSGSFVVRDEVAWSRYDMIDSLIYSPDSKNLFYTAINRPKEWFSSSPVWTIKDEEILSMDPVFSFDKKSFAYVTQDKDGKSFVVKDGIKWSKYDNIGDMVYSLDGNFAYIAQDKDWKVFVVKDGVEWARYDSIGGLVLSENWDHVAYVAYDDIGRPFVVKDGIEWSKYQITYNFRVLEQQQSSSGWSDNLHLWKITQLTMSPDGANFAYIVEDWYERLIVQNNKESKKYGDIRHLAYSSDSKHFTYVVYNSQDEWFVVKDWREMPKHKSIYYFNYSPDKSKYSYYDMSDTSVTLVRQGFNN